MPNPNALTYNTYVTQIATMAVVNTTTNGGGVVVGVDDAFNAIIPSMLNYAELRIQKELDLLASQIIRINYDLTAGANFALIRSDDFQTIQSISVANGAVATPLLPVSREFLLNVYNDASPANWDIPKFFNVAQGDLSTGGNTSTIIRFGPTPDQSYTLFINGTQWLPSLYATSSGNGNGTTYISTNYPDMLIQASMVYISQFQRNFLPTANDPQMPGSFETQYQTLLKSALELENRRKFRDSAWSSQSQSPVATPNR